MEMFIHWVLFLAAVGFIACDRTESNESSPASPPMSGNISTALLSSSSPSSLSLDSLPSSSPSSPSSGSPSNVTIIGNGMSESMLDVYRKWSQSVLSQLGLSGAGIVGSNGTGITSDFNCSHHGHGYFADVDRECKVFYFCYRTREGPFGDIRHFEKITFLCEAGMQFNQSSLSCGLNSTAADCQMSAKLYASSNSGLNGRPSITSTTTVGPFSSLFRSVSNSTSGNDTAPGFFSQVFG